MDYKLKARFLSLYSMILADGIIDAREMETLYRIGREEYGISQKEIDLALKKAELHFIAQKICQAKLVFYIKCRRLRLPIINLIILSVR